MVFRSSDLVKESYSYWHRLTVKGNYFCVKFAIIVRVPALNVLLFDLHFLFFLLKISSIFMLYL